MDLGRPISHSLAGWHSRQFPGAANSSGSRGRDLRWCNFDDEQLASLHALKHAELIDLRHSDVTQDGAAALRQALPNSEVLH